MNKRLEKWRQTLFRLQAELDQRPSSIRLMTMLGGCLLILLLWYLLLLSPARFEQQQLTQQLQAVQSQQQALETQIHRVAIGSAIGSSTLENQELLLQQESKALDQTIAQYERDFISPEKMQAMLNDALTNNPGLQLQGLTNLTSVKVGDAPFQGRTRSIDEHGIVLTVSGDYFSVLNYLQQLENLSWQVFWETMSYKVGQYPTATVTLRLYTLGYQHENKNE